MPRVKIDYIVSFSSEDPEHPANNLLEWEVSKKKWLCTKGESSCSVVLQLTKAIKIESVSIGAHHAASVEVLVGLSERPNEQYQVLVPTCMLLSPAESRRDVTAERVRSFSGAALAQARAQRWDRVRVVCNQPYNKHCRYGLSFIHIHEPEAPSLGALSQPLQPSEDPEDEDEFRPGELFAQHARALKDTSTGAQIRQASIDAIKNISDESTKLLKTPISKKKDKIDGSHVKIQCSNRQKESLMYTDDDKQPHAKIDQILQRHKEKKEKDDSNKTIKVKDKEKTQSSSNMKDFKEKPNQGAQKQTSKNETFHKKVSKDASSSKDLTSQKKRKRSDQSTELVAGPVCGSLRAVLAGAEFTLSGYQHPERGALRAAGLALGAAYAPDWRPATTHIVCAFPNTPKLRRARAAGGGAAAVAGAWLRACAEARRKLPWQWFAVQRDDRVTPPRDWDKMKENNSDTEMDTDDEIEKVLQQKKKRLKSPSKEPLKNNERDENTLHNHNITQAGTSRDVTDEAAGSRDVTNNAGASRDGTDDAAANTSSDSDVTFVRDERVQGNVTIADSDSDVETDEDEQKCRYEEIDKEKELPNFFKGLTFSIAEDLDSEYDRELLARYIRAYGGLLVKPEEVLDELSIQYTVSCERGAGRVAPEWLWACHARGALLA